MSQLPTRTLRDYLASLPQGASAGVVGQNLVIRVDLASMDQAVPIGGLTGQVLTKINDNDYETEWTTAGVGDMQKIVYDPQNIEADAFARANQTGTQDASTITGLATVATSGSYNDLSNKPTFLAPRISTIASTATLTPDVNDYDIVAVSAQAQALTIAAPSGSQSDGQRVTIRLRDDGTARALTWNAAYSSWDGSAFPTTTVIGKTMIYEFVWNAGTSKWDLLAGNPVQGLWA